MAKSILQLTSSAFQVIEVRSNDRAFTGDGTRSGKKEASVSSALDYVSFDAEKDVWRVRLTVSIEPNGTESTYPYSGNFVHDGVFRVDKEYSSTREERDIARLVAINGSSMLYGAVREVYAMLSGRGPAQRVGLLPTMDFRDMDVVRLPDDDQADQGPGSDEAGISSANETFGKFLGKADPGSTS